MKKYIFLICALLISSACIKKEQKQNSESQIVGMLNQNQTDSALEKINQELAIHKTDELLYLKASTLSMKAGIDIYALFPLLKMKIFDVAISQWSQNREFQKKADAQKNGIGLSADDLEAQKKESTSGKKYVPLDESELEYKLSTISTTIAYNVDQGHCEIGIGVIPVKSRGDYPLSFWHTTLINSENLCDDILRGHVGVENFDISPALDLEIKKVIQDDNRNEWQRRKNEIASKGNYVKILGSFWTLMDMVPMISKIPKVSNSGFKNLEEAQEILSQVKLNHPVKGDEMGEKSRKQLMMLSALKIVAHVQNAFNLALVKSPIDFICNSNDQAAEELIESERDALYLINAIEDPEIIQKNKELFADIKARYSVIVQNENDFPEIKDQRIAKLRAELERYKKNNCDQ